MKQLWIMRHGEAVSFAPRDHERALSSLATDQFKSVSEQIDKNIAQPQLILSSDAKRTRATASFWKKSFQISEENIFFEKELYGAGSNKILDVLQNALLPNDLERILLIGHNPGLSVFAMELMNQTHFSFQGFPTAGLLIVDLPFEHWKDIQFNQGIYNTFIQP